MVFPCQLVNKGIFSQNHKAVEDLLKLRSEKDCFDSLELFLERDKQSFEKCPHAIKVIAKVKEKAADKAMVEKSDPVMKEYVLGFLPTDLSFNLSQLMDTNNNFFMIEADFLESLDGQESLKNGVNAVMDLKEGGLRDKKIRDEDLIMQNKSGSD
jgi:hypothetical protein